MAGDAIVLEVGDRQVRLSSPDKVLFPESGWRKRDVVDYYLAVADAAVVHLRDRPCVLKRFPNGVGEPFFFQKRTPKTYEWLETATVTFPSGRHAEEVVIQDAAHLVFACNLGVIDFNPWACRRADLDHPDELRVDLDPQPGAEWDTVRRVALIARDVLTDHGLTGFPKTSRGMHVNARVSCALRWDEVPEVEPAELRIDTVPERVRTLGDPAADIDAHAASLKGLLELAARDEAEGLGDAPWPPNFKKQPGEAPRVQPSRRRKDS